LHTLFSGGIVDHTGTGDMYNDQQNASRQNTENPQKSGQSSRRVV